MQTKCEKHFKKTLLKKTLIRIAQYRYDRYTKKNIYYQAEEHYKKYLRSLLPSCVLTWRHCVENTNSFRENCLMTFLPVHRHWTLKLLLRHWRDITQRYCTANKLAYSKTIRRKNICFNLWKEYTKKSTRSHSILDKFIAVRKNNLKICVFSAWVQLCWTLKKSRLESNKRISVHLERLIGLTMISWKGFIYIRRVMQRKFNKLQDIQNINKVRVLYCHWKSVLNNAI